MEGFDFEISDLPYFQTSCDAEEWSKDHVAEEWSKDHVAENRGRI